MVSGRELISSSSKRQTFIYKCSIPRSNSLGITNASPVTVTLRRLSHYFITTLLQVGNLSFIRAKSVSDRGITISPSLEKDTFLTIIVFSVGRKINFSSCDRSCFQHPF